jgi:NAD(P)-dependent dehydrogenase (short-subunit alcohol dehydrogenase family)
MTWSPRIAIVTGAANGIGRSIALRLADDGLDVVVNDLDIHSDKLDGVAQEIHMKGRRSLALCADVSTEEGVRKLVSRASDNLGGVDVVSLFRHFVPISPLQ